MYNEPRKYKQNKIIARARLRRRKEHYRNMFRFTFALLIAITIATFTLSIRSFAYDRNEALPSYKYYTSYTVQEGDSLSMIAGRYMTDDYASVNKYISEVTTINHIASASDIYAGQKLILPYYSTHIK